jgi:RNA polymerase sigma factor (sigma-70 family)
LLAKTAIQAGWRHSKNPPSEVIEDLVQTAIINVFERGPWRTMMPRQLIAYLKTSVKHGTSNYLRGQRRAWIAKAKIRQQRVTITTLGTRAQAPLSFREDSPLTAEATDYGQTAITGQGLSLLKDRHVIRANNHEQELTTKMTVAEALDRLPAEEAEVVRLVHCEGHQMKEVAKELGIPLRTVERRLSAARAALRSFLSD